MIRKLQCLGLAMFLMQAILALDTSTATAQIEFESETGMATVKGSQVGAHILTTTVGNPECQGVNYHGTILGTSLPEIEVSPEYSECTLGPKESGLHAVVKPEGCKFLLHGVETVAGVREGSADIVCPGGKSLTVTPTLFGTTKCTITVGSQSGLEGVVYKNEGTGTTRDLKVELELSGIHYVHTAGTGFGACTTGTATNGTYKGVVTVKGYGSGGGHKGFWLDRKVQELEFESEAGTATVKGSQVGNHAFETTHGKVECTTANAHGTISGTSLPEVEVSPEYSECSSSWGGGSVTTNGCTYRLYSGATVAGVRKGSADLVCPKEKAIILHAATFGTNKCTISIGTQSGLEGVVYKNEGTGTTRDIKVELELSGIHYEEDGSSSSGFGACTTGTATNGTYKGAITLKGYDAEGAHKGFWNDP